MRYVFDIKNPDTLRYAIFYVIFEIGGGRGGGALLCTQNNEISVKLLYAKKTHFPLRYYVQKATHFASYFYMQKIMVKLSSFTLLCVVSQ